MRQAFHPTGATLRLVTECHRNWLPLALRGLIYQCNFAFFLFEIFCLQVHLGSSTLPWRLIDLLSKRQPLSIAFLRSYLTPPWRYWLMTAHGTIRSKDGRLSQDKEPFGVFREMNVCISGEKINSTCNVSLFISVRIIVFTCFKKKT